MFRAVAVAEATVGVDGIGLRIDGAQLGAECTMEWVTLRRASGGKQP